MSKSSSTLRISITPVTRRAPFLVGFSNYIWNIDLGYKTAQILKKKYPETIIVFGGPNYPDDREDQVQFLRDYPDIDIHIYKDGEIPFSELTGFLLTGKDLRAAKEARLPSVHTLLDDEPVFGETAPRIRDLTLTPSPYTMGLMDKFFDQKLVPTIQTNRGCPFTCTFCTEGGRYYNKVFKSTLDRKTTDVDYIVNHVKHTKTLRITDSNFGMFNEDQDFCEYLSALQAKTGYPEYIMCSTGKNKKERVLKCNELLNGAMRLTASVQSLDHEVLKAVKRQNISVDGLMYVSDETSETDTHAYSEIILALPHDSAERHEASIDGLMQIGIGNITQHQLALIHGTELNSRETRTTFDYQSRFRPIQRCAGCYRFLGEAFVAVEIEEIATANNTLSYDDYMDMRRLYLTVGLFYNDRIFGEIHALLRILNLSTFDWIKLIHGNINRLSPELQALYHDFSHDTAGELWERTEDLVADVTADVDRYESGEIGGNIIYKYRSKSIVQCFPELHEAAFEHLRVFLEQEGGDQGKLVDELEKLSRLQKLNLFDTSFETEERFSYDLLLLTSDPGFARNGGTIEDLHYPVTLTIKHTEGQRTTIDRELKFYGNDIPGLTMLISRYPVKRFWRRARFAGPPPSQWRGAKRLEVVA